MNENKMIKFLKAMEASMYDASEMMEHIDDVNDLIVEKYPFDRSFDEIVSQVSDWIESIEEKINNKGE